MRKFLLIAAIALALVLILLLTLPFLVDANRFRPLLESQLTQALGRDVTLGGLKLSILAGGIAASDLAVADDPAFSHTPFVRAKSLELGVDLWPLLMSRKLSVRRLTIEQPQIALIQNSAGDWNFSTLGTKAHAQAASVDPPAAKSPGGTLDLSVKLVEVRDGRVTIAKALRNSTPLVLDNLDADLRDFSPASSFPFSVKATAGGGAVNLDGKAGPIDATDAATTPVEAGLKVSGVHLDQLGNAILPPGTAGVVAVNAAADSSGKSLTLTGRVNADRLKLARNGSPATSAVEFDFAIDHDLVNHKGTLRRGDIHVGKALAALTGTYAQQNGAMMLDLTLAGPGMPVTELAGILPALGVALPAGSSLTSGSTNARIAIQGPTDALVSTGSVALSNARLQGFDLGSRLSMIERLVGIHSNPNTDIQAFAASIRAAPDGIRATDIRLVVPSIGEIDGAGSISPAHALNFKMTAKLETGAIGVALGHEPIPFTIEGTASQPVFHADVKGIAAAGIKGVAGSNAKAAVGVIKGLLHGK
jgi:AsmA protein